MENEINAPLVPTSNSNPIQILHIEDNDEDALLLQEYLGLAAEYYSGPGFVRLERALIPADYFDRLRAAGVQHYGVITGRDAPQRLLDAADLVTEMTKVKHPMEAGRKGQRGIEW